MEKLCNSPKVSQPLRGRCVFLHAKLTFFLLGQAVPVGCNSRGQKNVTARHLHKVLKSLAESTGPMRMPSSLGRLHSGVAGLKIAKVVLPIKNYLKLPQQL